MAATFVVAATKPKGDVFGSTRAVGGIVTLDATSGNFSPGFNNIWHAQATAKSAATGGFTLTWTATTVTLASAGSGDDFAVIVWGN